MTKEEVVARMSYLEQNHQAMAASISSTCEYNADLKRLQRAVRTKRSIKSLNCRRLHPHLEHAIWEEWRKLHLGAVGLKEATEAEMWEACVQIAETLTPIRGAPARDVLHHHVAGFMALYFEATGKQVRGVRDKNSLYDPHWQSQGGELFERVWQKLDPTISRTTLVKQVIKLSRPGSIVARGFQALFPFYRATIDAEAGTIVMPPGLTLRQFDLNPPIYCP